MLHGGRVLTMKDTRSPFRYLPGGRVGLGERAEDAVLRELREELGAEVEILCKIGVVSDYYNLIHRHNINNYYLCKVTSFGDKNLTDDEENYFHLSTLRVTYDEAVEEYEKVAAREAEDEEINAKELQWLENSQKHEDEYYAWLNKSDRKRQIICYHLYVESKK